MKVLVVDDDPDLVDILGYSLRREGFAVVAAHDGEQALAQVETEAPDLVVLDLKLGGGIDGFEVCRRLRQDREIPIIMLSANHDDSDIVTGLELGADDYVTKPYSPKQLVARIRAAMRRAGNPESPSTTPVAESIGPLLLNAQHLCVTVNGEEKRLTRTEYRVLECLSSNEGRVLTPEVLVEQVWGYNAPGDSSLVKTHIYHLRQKLERDPRNPRFIRTIPGVGYAFSSMG